MDSETPMLFMLKDTDGHIQDMYVGDNEDVAYLYFGMQSEKERKRLSEYGMRKKALSKKASGEKIRLAKKTLKTKGHFLSSTPIEEIAGHKHFFLGCY